jgi:pyruvate/2-oxoglutarate dehydrogenase complex dihydrolipoamide dehydrogenase (E3) component
VESFRRRKGEAVKYDAIIIGAGQAGQPLATKLAKRGWAVALIEGDAVGGSCINYGCTPSKTLIASARVAHVARRAADFGVRSGAIRVDFGQVMRRVHSVVDQFRTSSESSLNELQSLTLYRSYASFEAPSRVRVGHDVLEAERIFINTGARPAMPDIPGLCDVEALDYHSILTLTALPKRLIVLGGGYVGIEYAQAFRRLGSAVTIVDSGPQLLSREDRDIADEMRRVLEAEGVRVILNARAAGVRPARNGLTVSLTGRHAPRSVSGTHLFVATGVAPNTERLNLAAADVQTDEDGYVIVDGTLRTTAPGVWALGEVNRQGAFTHTSWDDHLIALDSLFGGPKTAAGRTPIYAVYTDPPLGRVGSTETEVRASGRAAQMAVMPMSSVGRAIERDETAGMMKVLVDGDNGQFLGAAILGIGGDEVIHTIADLMYAKAPAAVMKDAVHIHPTVSELLPTLLGKLEPLAPES